MENFQHWDILELKKNEMLGLNPTFPSVNLFETQFPYM